MGFMVKDAVDANTCADVLESLTIGGSPQRVPLLTAFCYKGKRFSPLMKTTPLILSVN